MSMSKRLAKYYSKHEQNADRMTALLKQFNLQAVAPRLKTHLSGYAKRTDQYAHVEIRSAMTLDAAAVADIVRRVDAPADVQVVQHVDQTVLHGVEVYYRGKKWSDSARGKLNRFVTSK